MYIKKINFLKDIPKTDLHVHLDGSLRLSTLIDLAKKENIYLPDYTEKGLKKIVYKDKYDSLDEYLKGFGYTTAVMQKEENIERIAYELAIDNFNEGVRYFEVRFAPQLHINENMGFEKVLKAVDRGLRRAKNEFNKNISEIEPEYNYGIIVCAMRFALPGFSQYYERLFSVHKFSDKIHVLKLASLELAKATASIRDNTDIQVVGFDLAGSENGYPAIDHKEAYDFAHKSFIYKTVHAGEAYGAESIFQAITELHADRIGHGLYLFDKNMILGKDVKDKSKYIENLANYIADKRITLEVCLTSNLQTSPKITALSKHSFTEMMKRKLSVSFCTDNRLVSNTSVTKEIKLAVDNFDLTPKMLKNIIIYGFKRSFYYGSYKERRDYVRKVISYYDLIEEQYK